MKHHRSLPPQFYVTNKKLEPEDIPLIRTLLADGLSSRNVAKKFNVSPSTIDRVRHGKTWKHVA